MNVNWLQKRAKLFLAPYAENPYAEWCAARIFLPVRDDMLPLTRHGRMMLSVLLHWSWLCCTLARRIWAMVSLLLLSCSQREYVLLIRHFSSMKREIFWKGSPQGSLWFCTFHLFSLKVSVYYKQNNVLAISMGIRKGHAHLLILQIPICKRVVAHFVRQKPEEIG